MSVRMLLVVERMPKSTLGDIMWMDLSMGMWDTAIMSVWSSSEPIMVEIGWV